MAFDATYTLHVKVRKPEEDVYPFEAVDETEGDGMVVVKTVYTVGDGGEGIPGAVENARKKVRSEGFELVGEGEDAVLDAEKKD